MNDWWTSKPRDYNYWLWNTQIFSLHWTRDGEPRREAHHLPHSTLWKASIARKTTSEGLPPRSTDKKGRNGQIPPTGAKCLCISEWNNQVINNSLINQFMRYWARYGDTEMKSIHIRSHWKLYLWPSWAHTEMKEVQKQFCISVIGSTSPKLQRKSMGNRIQNFMAKNGQA